MGNFLDSEGKPDHYSNIETDQNEIRDWKLFDSPRNSNVEMSNLILNKVGKDIKRAKKRQFREKRIKDKMNKKILKYFDSILDE
jgi:hypothetical protein